MPLPRIIAFTANAALFALPVGLAFFLGRILWLRWKNRRFSWHRETENTLFATYLAALLKITAIRQVTWQDISFYRSLETIQLVPLVTTLRELKNGWWAFCYPVFGNLIWFLPFGAFLRRYAPQWKAGKVWAVSAFLSAGIEICQWILGTGISDVDDILFNSIGGLLGWLVWGWALRLWTQRLSR